MSEEMTVQGDEIIDMLREYLTENEEAINVLGDEFYKNDIDEKAWGDVIDLLEFFSWLSEIQPILCLEEKYHNISKMISDMFSDQEICDDFIEAIEIKDKSLVGDILNDEWVPCIVKIKNHLNI